MDYLPHVTIEGNYASLLVVLIRISTGHSGHWVDYSIGNNTVPEEERVDVRCLSNGFQLLPQLFY